MLTYEAFMKHAAKVTETASESKPVLRGVYHHPDGSLVVSDSKRLYKVFGIEHDKEPGSVYTPKWKKINEPYPDTDRIVQMMHSDHQVYTFETAELLRAVDLVSCVAIVYKETPVVRFVENQLICRSASGERAFYYLPVSFEDRFGFALNGQFLLDALKLLKAAKCKEVSFVYQTHLRPIFLTADNIVILIMPIRVY